MLQTKFRDLLALSCLTFAGCERDEVRVRHERYSPDTISGVGRLLENRGVIKISNIEHWPEINQSTGELLSRSARMVRSTDYQRFLDHERQPASGSNTRAPELSLDDVITGGPQDWITNPEIGSEVRPDPAHVLLDYSDFKPIGQIATHGGYVDVLEAYRFSVHIGSIYQSVKVFIFAFEKPVTHIEDRNFETLSELFTEPMPLLEYEEMRLNRYVVLVPKPFAHTKQMAEVRVAAILFLR